jgi:hypothetical protein
MPNATTPAHTPAGPTTALTATELIEALAADRTVFIDDLEHLPGAESVTCYPKTKGRLVAAIGLAQATNYRSVLAPFRLDPLGVVLSPHAPGSAQALGTDVSPAIDPLAGKRPGYGAAIDGSQIVPVQVPLWENRHN